MKLSFIIPVLNEAEHIQSILLALANFRKNGHEVLVVDGGSQDATLTLVQEQSPLLADRIIQSPKGRARQMNAGATEASGDVLVFLHADTRLPEHADLMILNALQNSNGQKDIRPHWGRFDVMLSGHHWLFKLIAWNMNIRSRLSGIATGDQCLFIKREIFDQINGFPEQSLMEDIEISKRLKHISSPVCLKDKVMTSSRRWEEQGIIKTILLMWYLRVRYFLGSSPDTLVKIYYRNA